MKMKKNLAVLVVFCAMLTTFTGCSKKDKNEADNNNSKVEENNSPATNEIPNEEQKPETNNETTNSMDYKDGDYEVIMDKASSEDNHGWYEYIKATVKNGKIDTIVYNSKNDEGKLKTEMTKEDYPMTPHPSEWIPQLNNELKKAKVPEDIQDIVGATNSSRSVKKLYAKLIENMKSGKTETTEINTVSAENKK